MLHVDVAQFVFSLRYFTIIIEAIGFVLTLLFPPTLGKISALLLSKHTTIIDLEWKAMWADYNEYPVGI